MDIQPNLRPGDVLTAEIINQIIRGQQTPQVDIRGGPGLFVRRGPRGIQIATGDSSYFGLIGKATGTITARVGNTPGTGSVSIQTLDPSTGDFVDADYTLDVYNISSTTAGIPINTWCIVNKDENGNYWVWTVDCGN